VCEFARREFLRQSEWAGRLVFDEIITVQQLLGGHWFMVHVDITELPCFYICPRFFTLLFFIPAEEASTQQNLIRNGKREHFTFFKRDVQIIFIVLLFSLQTFGKY